MPGKLKELEYREISPKGKARKSSTQNVAKHCVTAFVHSQEGRRFVASFQLILCSDKMSYRQKVASFLNAGVFANDTLDDRGSITVNHSTPYESIRISCNGIPVIIHPRGRLPLRRNHSVDVVQTIEGIQNR